MNRLTVLAFLLLAGSLLMPAVVSAVPDRFGTISNSFYISSYFTITTAMLKNPASNSAKTLLNGYSDLAKHRLSSYSALNGKSVQYGNAKISNVVQQACPAGTQLPAVYICHYISATIQLNYTNAQFSSSPLTGAVNYIQDAINTGGNLDCAFKAYNNQITSQSGGSCSGTSPNKSPTGAPASAPSMTVATLTNNFVVANNANIQTSTFNTPNTQAYRQLVAAYQSLIKKSLATFNPQGTLKYMGTATLGTVTSASCFNVGSSYKCNAVPAIHKLSYNAADFSTPPGNTFVSYVQNKINNGALECELHALYSGTPISVITGGGCKGSPTRAPVKSPTSPTPKSPTRSPASAPMTVATLTNNFVVANNANIQTSTFNTPNTQAYRQLVAAYQSLIKKSLATFNPQGTLKYMGTATLGTVTSASCFNVGSSYKCNAVPAIHKLSYNAADFSTPPGNAFVSYVQNKINNGALECELHALYSGTPISVITGGGCK